MHTIRGTFDKYSETCVRKPPLRLTVVDVERWLSYKGMSCNFASKPSFHINPHSLKSVSEVALLHRFHCTHNICLHGEIRKISIHSTFWLKKQHFNINNTVILPEVHYVLPWT